MRLFRWVVPLVCISTVAAAFSPRDVEDWRIEHGSFQGPPTCFMFSRSETGPVLALGVGDISPFVIAIVDPPIPAREMVGTILILRTGGREFVAHGMVTHPLRQAIGAVMGMAIEDPIGDATEATRRFLAALRDGAESIEVQFFDDSRMEFPARGGREAVALLYECMRPPT